jgi:hypothetical protein
MRFKTTTTGKLHGTQRGFLAARAWIATFAILSAGTLLPGCGGGLQSGALQRASFDLGCAEGKMATTTLAGGPNVAGQPMDGTQIGVRGCGKRATYVFTDDKGWVLNSPIQSD